MDLAHLILSNWEVGSRYLLTQMDVPHPLHSSIISLPPKNTHITAKSYESVAVFENLLFGPSHTSSSV